MLSYYIELAAKEMRRHPVLAFLISMQLAVGVAAFIACAQQQVALSRDPLPGLSENLYHVQLDPRSEKFALDGIEPPVSLTYSDAKYLLASAWGEQQSISVGGIVKIIPDRAGATPFFVDARAVTADFFQMFAIPISPGSAWGKDTDENGNKVALITNSLSKKLFGDASSVGKTLRLGIGDYRVIGTIGDWAPEPRYFDLYHKDKYAPVEQVYLPFGSIPNVDDSTWGDVDCWATPDNSNHYANQPCFWINYWVRLADPSAKAGYEQKLVDYSRQQKAMGRYGVAPNVRLRSLRAWVAFNHAVPEIVQLESWLSFGFLAVCLVNTMGLLLAKFSRMAPSIGMRRALGASTASVLSQLMAEALMYGVTGGVLAMVITSLGIIAVRWQGGYLNVSQVTGLALASAFSISLLCALLVGVLPAWRCVKAPIHLQIKTS